MKVLFLCYGNIARSQMAEGYYNHFTNSSDAKSAGVSNNAGLRYAHPAPDIIKIMLEEGIDISEKTVKKFSSSMINDVDNIVVMCDIDDCPKSITSSGKLIYKPFSDPYGLGLDYARSVRNDIKEMILDLIHSE
jgi:arsenate reductase